MTGKLWVVVGGALNQMVRMRVRVMGFSKGKFEDFLMNWPIRVLGLSRIPD